MSYLLQYPLPNNPPWYELFLVAKKDVFTVAREVHALYSMPKARYISVYRETLNAQGGVAAANQVSCLLTVSLRSLNCGGLQSYLQAMISMCSGLSVICSCAY